ncbi:MAG: hypothetical protein QGG50_03420 [Methanopyri archaeon]|nr:hypothetical protein [Methanopyri archaeon]
MYSGLERINMPYEFDVSRETYGVLGAIGEQTAIEAGLEKDYSFTESYDVMRAGTHRAEVNHEGYSKWDVEGEISKLERSCSEKGIHAKVEGDMFTGYRTVRWEFVKSKETSRESESGFMWHNDHITKEHSFKVNEYGALPEKLTGTVDALKDTSAVTGALYATGKEKVTYELLESLSGYDNPEGNTAEVFGLTEEGTYAELREQLDEEVAERKATIKGSWVNKVPLAGKMISTYRTGKVEIMREHKADIIDGLEESLLA